MALMCLWLAAAHLIPEGCLARAGRTRNTLPYLQFASTRRRSLVEGKQEKIPRQRFIDGICEQLAAVKT